jgi:hypothetical protein
MAFDTPKVYTEESRIYGIFMCDWFAEDYPQPWNNYRASSYAMCQGLVYLGDSDHPKKWQGLLEMRSVWRIEWFPRKDFDLLK